MKKSLIICSLIAALIFSGCSKNTSSSKTTATPSATTAQASSDSSSKKPTYTWTVAMNVSEATLNYKMMAKFKELIESKSNGAIKVNLYANGQLGNDTEQMQGLIDGSVDFTTTITSGLTSFVKEYGVFDLPNLFPDLTTMRKVLDTKSVLDELNTYSTAKNVRLMGLADAGFRETTSNKPIHSLDDIAGLKIRVIQNPYHIAYWKALGANPLAMDFSEVYIGLQQKTIEAEENPYMNIVANKFYEVQKYIVETDHLGHIIVFLMNNNLYNGLSDENKKLVNECAEEAVVYTRGLADESIAGYKKTVEDYGTTIITLDPSVKAAMQDKASGVYDDVRKAIGDKLVDTMLTQVKQAKENN
ncbi:MAG: TRAP transporter substrate-binding protein [Spirochaetia bacterium]|jgi:tripartite ATP-independent transporter DctP family solute receptor|nr:TRAP transporter substrate-binding protein [Spirochaetia bacterium]